jgi:hypothetical protein
LLSPNLIIGEHKAINGQALIVTDESSTGPSGWPALSQETIIINTPNGPLPGGLFIEQDNELTEEDLIEFISQIRFTE